MADGKFSVKTLTFKEWESVLKVIENSFQRIVWESQIKI